MDISGNSRSYQNSNNNPLDDNIETPEGVEEEDNQYAFLLCSIYRYSIEYSISLNYSLS